MKTRAKTMFNADNAMLSVSILAGLLIRMVLANWSETFSTDVFYYVVKAIEVGRGNMGQLPSLSVGWSYILAAVYAFIPPQTYASAVTGARIASLLFDAATATVLFAIAVQIVGRLGKFVVVLLYVCMPLSVIVSTSGMPDSAFVFFLTTAVWHAMKSPIRTRHLVISGAAGAACVWLRPNGILVIPLLCVVALLNSKNTVVSAWKAALTLAGTCVLLSLPMWAGRAYQFGNPFDYGAATKLFINTLDASLSPNIQNPAIRDFLSHTTPAQLFDRFTLSFVRELVRSVAYTFTVPDILSAVVFLGAAVALVPSKKPKIVSLVLLAAAYWLVGLVPTLPVHQKSRHLLPLIPFAIPAAVYAYGRLSRYAKNTRSVALALVLLCMIAAGGGLATSWRISSLIRANQSHDTRDWAVWSAEHLSGTVVTMDSYAIQSLLIDRALANRSNARILESPMGGMEFSFPGYFSSLPEELQWLRRMHASYVVVDDEYLRRAPYFRDIVTGQESGDRSFSPVYTNTGSSNPWKVTVLAVH